MPHQVFAVGHLSNLEVDVEDSVSVLMACGETGKGFPVHLRLDYLQRPPQRICEVIGDAGKVRYDFYANQVETYDLHSRTRQVLEFKDFDRNRMFLDEVSHLLACLRGQAQPLVDLREATRSLRIFLLADTSLRTGAVVTCDW